MMKSCTPFFAIVLLSFTLISCGKRDMPPAMPQKDTIQSEKLDTSRITPAVGQTTAITGLAEAGQKIFYSTKYGKITDACASCHTDGLPTTKDTRIRPGHTLVGVTSRVSTWNGQFKGNALAKNAYGATMCAVMYLHKGDDMATVMPKGDIDAMNAYLEAIKNNPGAIASTLKIQWVTKPALHEEDKIDEKAAGTAAKAVMMLPADPDAGKNTYDRTCAYCHAMTDKKVGPPLKKAMDTPQAGAKSVRCGSAAMPFYAKDILSDQQVADVIAHIQQQLGQ
ncbi:MAG: cytochrome c [Bacteroidota bacterium]|nr:cytochrome c [Bacteroidota bacterium]MDP4233634.1 cytochrome c [Bacteroidota bacterium]MDP4243106.1 cytochrome c [Bacteroidota bacterium]MDP4288448.1 cytochrome c [Bacteroidota bacterium]